MFDVNNFRNAMGNDALMPTTNNMIFGGGALPAFSPNLAAISGPAPGGGLPAFSPNPAAQTGMTNQPVGQPVQVSTPPSAGFIPASEGTIAPYNPATGQSGYIDESQRDAYERFTTSPDYLFRFNEGQRALDSSAAARGMLMSGRQLRALTELGQNLASQEYGNYMNRLYGVAGLAPSGGQGLAAQGGAQGFNNLFNAAGSLGTNLGNIAGAQGTNMANIWGSALGNIDFGGLSKGIGSIFGGGSKVAPQGGGWMNAPGAGLG